MKLNTHEEVLSLLGTDYVPTGSDATSLDTTISQFEDDLKAIDTRVQELTHEIALLNDRKIETEEKIKLAKGLQAPIRRVPPEILGEIFIYVLHIWSLPYQETDSLPFDDITISSPPLLLFRVCRKWRRIAMYTPGLFTILPLKTRPSLNPLKVFPKWLEWSGSLPLNVSL
ncbi:hypothetical protein M422DRAFT_196108, partial [Sphaerobolus stellatus SS14]